MVINPVRTTAAKAYAITLPPSSAGGREDLTTEVNVDSHLTESVPPTVNKDDVTACDVPFS